MPAAAVGPRKRPCLLPTAPLLKEKLFLPIEEKYRKSTMEGRMSGMHVRLRHRSEHVVVFVHEHDVFFRRHTNSSQRLTKPYCYNQDSIMVIRHNENKSSSRLAARYSLCGVIPGLTRDPCPRFASTVPRQATGHVPKEADQLCVTDFPSCFQAILFLRAK
jgi:hypothetical protein